VVQPKFALACTNTVSQTVMQQYVCSCHGPFVSSLQDSAPVPAFSACRPAGPTTLQDLEQGCGKVALTTGAETTQIGPNTSDFPVYGCLDMAAAAAFGMPGGLMNIPDAYSHPLFNPEIDRATQYTTRNILCTAIKDMSGKNIAVVQVRVWTDWSGCVGILIGQGCSRVEQGRAGPVGQVLSGSPTRQCTPACMPWAWPATSVGLVAANGLGCHQMQATCSCGLPCHAMASALHSHTV
jgi:hypothetical protein